jgi:hypothetical protein
MVKKPDLRGELSLRRLAVVIVNNARKDVATANLSGSNGFCTWNRNLLVGVLVRTRCVVVSTKLPMTLADELE